MAKKQKPEGTRSVVRCTRKWLQTHKRHFIAIGASAGLCAATVTVLCAAGALCGLRMRNAN